ncbi:AAA family ATPase [Ramlibacter sp.]|uniref:AAA family ATPase n=1 Tax=Ramlibacter sp. TaxID=1917967 RepID=UPI002B989BBA|nr:AAA family ATPase [Ramlibacter sp.]HWI83491.1 AAA family ATPase [Ramlibacter sp.]
MEAVTRGAASAIFSPDNFVHPLLLLMPYGPDAPKHLRQLQASVLEALEPEADAESRIAAALALRDAVHRPGTRIPDPTVLLIEVLKRVTADLPRPALMEELAHAHLLRIGIRIDTDHLIDPLVSPVPRLLRDEPLKSSPTDVRDSNELNDALDVWSEVIAKLMAGDAEQQLKSMDADDLYACLRVLVLYLLYKRAPDYGDDEKHRLEYFESIGLSLWNLVRERAVELAGSSADFESCFGDAAQRSVWHRLRAEVLLRQNVRPSSAQGAEAPTRGRLPGTHLVIAGKIPPGANDDDRETLKRYARLQRPIPIAKLPDVTGIEHLVDTLSEEFPWARSAIEELAADISSRRLFGAIELGMTPTLLVGMPGCGKSRLVRRIAEELRLPLCPMALAGMNDSMALLGTARGWATGQPSPLIDVMLQHLSASALVLLDEIDKVGGSTRNGVPPTVALLNLLEPENAKRWYDTYLQTTCDLSKLMFWATANTLGSLSKPLLSRLRIVIVEEPRPSDFGAIARGALRDIAVEWGLDEATLIELAPEIPVQGVRNAREVRTLVRAYLHRWSREHLGQRHLH